MSKTNKITGTKVFKLFVLFKALGPITGGQADRPINRLVIEINRLIVTADIKSQDNEDVHYLFH